MKRYKQTEIADVAEILKKDGVISVPTDTVYGICASINSHKGYEKLINIKNRPNSKPFPIMCLNKEQVKNIAIINSDVEKLIDLFMPGPITLILNKKPNILLHIIRTGTEKDNKVAIRIASSEVLKQLIQKLGCPIFLTSANKSGNPVCKSLDEIEEKLPSLDGIIEGNVSLDQASTIIDCTSNKYKIEREGPILLENINEELKLHKTNKKLAPGAKEF